MTEENANVGEAQEIKSVESPSAPPKPRVVKEAEHKLKEMSRKAKERKTAQNNARHQKGLSETNYFWLVIGGLGALGVGYLVFWTKGFALSYANRRDPTPKPRQRFKRPVAYASVPPPEKVNEPVVEKEERQSVPKFELNCF